MKEKKMTEFLLQPQRPALLEGFDNELHVLARLSAPAAPKTAKKRKSLNLSIVIDRSGSMGGQPLEEAKKCASMIINSLDVNDRISIITYHDHAELLVPSILAENKSSIISAISNITTAGRTALHAGWLMGAEQVAQFKSELSINRVLLLSDGAANVGLTQLEAITPQCSDLAQTGVTTSTYGLGRHFNEDLMIEMAKAGQGQGYYGETAEDLADPFKEEFDLLTNTMVTNLEIFVEYPNFIKLELLNTYIGADPKWKMPNLAYEGEAWALFKLNIKQENINQCANLDILRSHISYRDLQGNQVETEVKSIRLIPINQNAFAAVAEEPDVKSRLLELRAAAFQDRARRAANNEDWHEVAVIIGHARQEAGDNAWVRESLSSLERYAKRRERRAFSKEALYSADKFRSRLSSNSEATDVYSASHEAVKPMYLRRKQERGKRM